jgi:hypothetical protein
MEEEEECEYESETESLRSEERRQKRRVEMGKEAVGGGGGGGNGDGGGEEAAGEAGRPDREILVKMDSQVLDCTICFEPLRPPIYQVITTATAHNICCIYCFYFYCFHMVGCILFSPLPGRVNVVSFLNAEVGLGSTE